MNKDVLIKFGNKVKVERQKRHLSQEQFAEIAGVHRTYIGMIERAEKNITLTNIAKIAAAFEINIEELFQDEDKL
ncbi:MAG: helix-turn-helix domain-containing protein [Acidobacteriota bacterium]|nr:helix-turn-helix domain-containing protein [Acidobacteriota bacterium]